MEFSETVRRRRMVRRYDTTRPVDPAAIDAITAAMLKAPSAGFSQGTALLILDTPDDIERFRQAATPAVDAENWLSAHIDAPVVILVLANKSAYLDRYAEPDKGFDDRREDWWTAPYWHVDAGMAAMIGLLATVDQGLAACFFGVEITTVDPIRAAFDIPDKFWPTGVISIGYADEAPRNLTARRKDPSTLVHRGRFARES
jgi:nitroreductase